MKGALFTLSVVTPSGTFLREIGAIRLTDGTGSFGVLKGHTNFLAVLQPSLGYYTDAKGKEIFFAVDGGIFTISGKTAMLTTREIFESEQPEELAATMEKTILARARSEQSFSAMLQGIEKTFIEKALAFARDTA